MEDFLGEGFSGIEIVLFQGRIDLEVEDGLPQVGGDVGTGNQEKVKALPAEGREEAVAQLLDDQTDSFFAMVAGKWRALKGRVLEIFVRSM